jgi:putative flippase GtrA
MSALGVFFFAGVIGFFVDYLFFLYFRTAGYGLWVARFFSFAIANFSAFVVNIFLSNSLNVKKKSFLRMYLKYLLAGLAGAVISFLFSGLVIAFGLMSSFWGIALGVVSSMGFTFFAQKKYVFGRSTQK